MNTDPASAIKREVLQLIDLQIETLKQESSLDCSQFDEYQACSENPNALRRTGSGRSDSTTVWV